jgi:hypothetical protein
VHYVDPRTAKPDLRPTSAYTVRVCGRFGLEHPEWSETRFDAQMLPDVDAQTVSRNTELMLAAQRSRSCEAQAGSGFVFVDIENLQSWWENLAGRDGGRPRAAIGTSVWLAAPTGHSI